MLAAENKRVNFSEPRAGDRRFLGKFGTSLNWRLTALFILVALIPMVTIAVLSIQKASTALNDLGLSKVAQDNAATTEDLLTFLGQFSTDVLMLSDTPPVQAIIRAVDNDGIDPKSDDSFDVWVNRLTQIFAATTRNKEFYQQIRYINAQGEEMVRIDFKNGTVDIVSGTDRLVNTAGAGYLQEAMRLSTGDVYISELNLNRENGRVQAPHVPVVRYSTPIYSPAGEFRGVVVTNVFARSFLDRLDTDIGAVFLSTEDGSFARHTDPSRIFGSDVGTGIDVDSEFKLEHDVLRNNGGSPVAQINGVRGEVVALQMVGFDTANPERYYLIARTLPTSVITGPVTSLRNTVIVVALVLVALAAALAVWLARGITRPLVKIGGVLKELAESSLPRLSAVTKAVGDGDLTSKINLTIQHADVGSRDEIGRMAEAFNAVASEIENVGGGVNAMAISLQGVVRQVADTANEVATASEQLASVADQAGSATKNIAEQAQGLSNGARDQGTAVASSADAVKQLGSAINQIAAGTQQQSQGVDATSRAIAEVSKAITDVAQNAQDAAEGSRVADEAARKGLGIVEQTVTGMGQINAAVQDVAARIGDLGEQSAEIGKIVAVIDDIAAQTNLLALNAAIEAARAGEQGRGFAVVADEVRQLAERVTQATSEIAGLIDGVQKGVEESVKATERGTSEVDEGSKLAAEAGISLNEIQEAVQAVTNQVELISAAAEQVTASSDEMVKSIEGVSAITEQTTAATEEMSASNDEVQQAMDQISQITEQSGQAIEESSASTEELTSQVDEVVASSAALGEMANTLTKAVSVFTLDANTATENDSGDSGERAAYGRIRVVGSDARRRFLPASGIGPVNFEDGVG
jgi:methyl-accepting chemotaxis protein